MIREIFFKTLCLAVAGVFFCETLLQPYSAYAQTLPSPSTFLQPLNQSFAPVMIRGMQINPQDGLSMNLIVDSGDEPLDETTFKSESEKLIKYFLTALTVPEEDLWVNLSPYEKDRLTSSALAQTAMGEELLAQDYILKQLTAALINPDGKTGKEFWNKIYEKAYEVFGTADVPVDSFNKIWIMPEKAEVFAQNDTVLILDSKLKVMMEEDYLAREQNVGAGSKPAQDQGRVVNPPLQNDIKSVMRDVVLPVITQEINNGQNFAPLRQIFHALILARWYKDNLKESILGQVYADQSKVKGIDQDNTASLQVIYNQYLDAFRSGAQGLIKEEYNPATQSLAARKYVTGGWKTDLAMLETANVSANRAAQMLSNQAGLLNQIGFHVDVQGVDGAMMEKVDRGRLFFIPKVAFAVSFLSFWNCANDNSARNAASENALKDLKPLDSATPHSTSVALGITKDMVLNRINAVATSQKVSEFLTQYPIGQMGSSSVLGYGHTNPLTEQGPTVQTVDRLIKQPGMELNDKKAIIENKLFPQAWFKEQLDHNYTAIKITLDNMSAGKFTGFGIEQPESTWSNTERLTERLNNYAFWKIQYETSWLPFFKSINLTDEQIIDYLVVIAGPEFVIPYFGLISQKTQGFEDFDLLNQINQLSDKFGPIAKTFPGNFAKEVFSITMVDFRKLTQWQENQLNALIAGLPANFQAQGTIFVNAIKEYREVNRKRNKVIRDRFGNKGYFLLIGNKHVDGLINPDKAMMSELEKLNKKLLEVQNQILIRQRRVSEAEKGISIILEKIRKTAVGEFQQRSINSLNQSLGSWRSHKEKAENEKNALNKERLSIQDQLSKTMDSIMQRPEGGFNAETSHIEAQNVSKDFPWLLNAVIFTVIWAVTYFVFSVAFGWALVAGAVGVVAKALFLDKDDRAMMAKSRKNRLIQSRNGLSTQVIPKVKTSRSLKRISLIILLVTVLFIGALQFLAYQNQQAKITEVLKKYNIQLNEFKVGGRLNASDYIVPSAGMPMMEHNHVSSQQGGSWDIYGIGHGEREEQRNLSALFVGVLWENEKELTKEQLGNILKTILKNNSEAMDYNDVVNDQMETWYEAAQDRKASLFVGVESILREAIPMFINMMEINFSLSQKEYGLSPSEVRHILSVVYGPDMVFVYYKNPNALENLLKMKKQPKDITLTDLNQLLLNVKLWPMDSEDVIYRYRAIRDKLSEILSSLTRDEFANQLQQYGLDQQDLALKDENFARTNEELQTKLIELYHLAKDETEGQAMATFLPLMRDLIMIQMSEDNERNLWRIETFNEIEETYGPVVLFDVVGTQHAFQIRRLFEKGHESTKNLNLKNISRKDRAMMTKGWLKLSVGLLWAIFYFSSPQLSAQTRKPTLTDQYLEAVKKQKETIQNMLEKAYIINWIEKKLGRSLNADERDMIWRMRRLPQKEFSKLKGQGFERGGNLYLQDWNLLEYDYYFLPIKMDKALQNPGQYGFLFEIENSIEGWNLEMRKVDKERNRWIEVPEKQKFHAFEVVDIVKSGKNGIYWQYYLLQVPKSPPRASIDTDIGNGQYAFSEIKGGVDLDTSDMDFQSSGQIDRAVMQGLPKFNPNDVIGVTISNVTITPIPSVYRLLGLNDKEEDAPDPGNPDEERHEFSMAIAGRES